MLGIDVLQLPFSHNGHQYATVFVDYFMKWPKVLVAEDRTIETTAPLSKLAIIGQQVYLDAQTQRENCVNVWRYRRTVTTGL